MIAKRMKKIAALFLAVVIAFSGTTPIFQSIAYADEIDTPEETVETVDAAQEEIEEAIDTAEEPEEISEELVLPDYDFASKRLLVRAGSEDLLDEPVIASLGELVLIQYETEEGAKEGYLRLSALYDVEVDAVIYAAEGEEEGEPTEYMTEEENPFTEAEEAVDEVIAESYDVAVIDTGATNADKILSVLGDDGIDVNGHGQRMIDIIKGLSPDAKVLSIKAIGDSGAGDISSVYAAIKLAIESDVKVINLSISAFKTEDSFAVEEAIREAVSKGITVVGAAGNNGMDAQYFVPGGIDEVIVVGASKGNASNYGETIDHIVDVNTTSAAAAVVTGLILNHKGYDLPAILNLGLDIDAAIEAYYAFGTQFYISDGAGGGSGQIIGGPDMGFMYRVNRAYTYFDNGGWDDSTTPGSGNTAHQPQMSRGGSITDDHLNWWVVKMQEQMEALQKADGTYIGPIAYLPDIYNASGTGYWTDVKEIIRSAMQEACDKALASDPQGTNARIVGVAWEYVNPGSTTKIDYDCWYFTPGYGYLGDNDFHTLFGGSPSNPRYPTEDNLSGSVGWDALVDINNDGVYSPTETWRKFAYDKAAAGQPAANNQVGRIYFIAVTDNQPKARTGYLTLVKSSSNTAITNGNICYSLIGAKYEIYDNAALSGNPVATLTVADEAGNTNKVELTAGRYYFKEVAAGKGYSLKTYNAATDYIEVTSSNTEDSPAVIRTTDAPKDDPEQMTISKAAATGNNPRITDSSATFKVEFFANDSWSGSAARTWYYKTIDGRVRLGGTAYLDSSYTNSPLYENNGITGVFPLGTVRVTEVKAPAGYLSSDFALEGKISLNASGNAEFTWTSMATTNKLKYESDGTPSYLDPAISGGVKFAKIDAVTGSVVTSGAGSLADATIGIYKTGETAPVLTIKTGADGIATTGANDLEAGSYYAKEIAASDGYKLNTSWRVDFTISQDGVIVDKTGEGNQLKEDPFFGGVKFSKIDADRNESVPQGNATLAGAEITIYNNSGKEIALKDGTKVANGAAIPAVLRTDAQGNASTTADALPTGSYYAVETKASLGYRLNTTWKKDFSIVEDGVIVDKTDAADKLPEYIVPGSAAVIKVDSQNTTAQGDASLTGIRFAIVNNSSESVVYNGTLYANGRVVAVITTDASGKAATAAKSLPYGGYTVYELRSDATIAAGDTYSGSSKLGNSIYANNSGYLFKANSKAITLTTDGQTVSCDFTDDVVRGGVKLEKWDKQLNSKTAQGDADFSGIKFEITNKSANPVYVGGTKYEVGAVVYTFTTNAAGDAQTANNLLPYGTYEVKEVATNGSYLLTDGEARTFTIRTNGQIANATEGGNEFKNSPVRGGVLFGKIDAETDAAAPQGRATLAGAEITIYNNSDKAVLVDGTLYSKGQAVMTLTTGEDGKVSTVVDALPYGTYYAIETKASEGYLLNNAYRVDFQIRENGKVIDTTNAAHKTTASTAADAKSGWLNIAGGHADTAASLPEKIKRADIRFVKVDIDGYPISGIPFLISRLDENGNKVESHVIVSDENGIVDTSARPKTDAKVNSLDTLVSDGKITDDAALDMTSNVWFGEQSAREDGVGSLIYASYIIEELSCAKNEGQTMLSAKYFADKEDGTFNAQFENAKTYDLDNIFIDLYVHPKSNLVDMASGTKTVGIGETIKVKDTVEVDHIKVGKSYKIVSEIYYEDRNGNFSSAPVGTGSTPFTPSRIDATNTTSATVDVVVELDTTNLDGGNLHAVSTLYLINDEGADVKIVSHNFDYSEPNQTLLVPYLGTIARDTATKDNVGSVRENAGIIDRIKVEGLPEFRRFIIEATLRYKEDGSIVKGVGGEDLVKTITVYVDNAVSEPQLEYDGSYTVPSTFELDMPEFIFDASDMDGKTLVATEVIKNFATKESYLTHYDLTDEDQSVHFPEVLTEAKDKNTQLHTAVSGITTIVDTVTVKNAIVGQEYTVKGNLVYKEDFTDANGTLHKAEEVIAEHEGYTFTATSETMVVDLEFNVDAALLAGTSAVVFEDLYHKDVPVAKHHDIEDEKQTVNFPEVKTSAIDTFVEDHFGYALEEVSIVDSVSLTNLTVGDTYKVYGTLMNDSGERVLVDGEPILAESDAFIANAKDMTKEITFTFDARSLGGVKTVVFEKLMVITETGGEVEIAQHEDPSDEGQTVEYIKPSVHTTATDTLTGEHQGYALPDSITIDDEIVLTGLLAGKEYTVKGKLADKTNSTEDEMVFIEGIEESITFIAPEDIAVDDEYTITMTFTVPTELIREKTVVAFETLSFKDRDIAIHADIDDPEQSVEYADPEVHTAAEDKATEGHVGSSKEETVTIKDTVIMKGLLAGHTYTLKGRLADKTNSTEDEVIFIDGITKDIEFTAPEDISIFDEYAVELEFEVPASLVRGKAIVVFEKLYYKDLELAVHTDLTDEDQTVYYPSVRTVAEDKADGDKFIASKENQIIVDTVYYEGFIPSKEYEMVLTVYDKTAGKVIDGLEVRKDFTTNAEGTGEVKIEVLVDGEALSGHVLVMFEKAYKKSVPDKPMAVHEDPNDKDQTIGVPVIRTIVVDSVSGTNIVRPYWTNNVVDIVIYSGLIPGVEYELDGVFVAKKDGVATTITSSITFTPKEANGRIEVPFSFEGIEFEGAEYVAFETLKCNGKVIAEHKDLDDEDQLMTVKPIGKITIDKDNFPFGPGGVEETPSTGDTLNIHLWLSVFMTSIVLVIIFIVSNKKRKRG